MKLIRYDYSALPTSREFDCMMNHMWAGLPRFGSFVNEPESANIATDLYEDDANVYARLELPGFKKEELSVQLENSVLTVSVERKAGKEDDESLSFERSVTIPEGVEADKVSAKYEDGVLTVTLPKTPERKPKLIEIK
jgi:HSP20 family protein